MGNIYNFITMCVLVLILMYLSCNWILYLMFLVLFDFNILLLNYISRLKTLLVEKRQDMLLKRNNFCLDQLFYGTLRRY